MTRRMTTREAQDNLGDVLRTLSDWREPVILEDQGRPVGVIITPGQYDRYAAMAKELFFQTVDEIQQRNADADPDELLAEVTEAVEAVRRERNAARETASHRH